MSKILDMLQRGDRLGAVEALRRLVGAAPGLGGGGGVGIDGGATVDGAAVRDAVTSEDSVCREGTASLQVWLEVLRRMEAEGVLSASLSEVQLAARARETLAACLRQASADPGKVSADPARGPAGAAAADGDGGPSVRSTAWSGDGSDPLSGLREASGSWFASGAPPRPPEKIGNYIILRELGRGGFGRVFHAVSDDELRLQVAIKVLYDSGGDQAKRFVAERNILASVRHPNVARFEASGVLEDGRPWIAMEYVEGLPLLAYCERERLSTEQRLQLFRKICEAVHEAHKWNVVHLDIKPANIMVTIDGQPKLLDFGIARITRSFDPTTRTTVGRAGLTYQYSSPEQLRNEPVSYQSDVYNLGLVLYEVLTGSRARQANAEEVDAYIREVLARTPEEPSKRVARNSNTPAAHELLGDALAVTTSATTAQGGTTRLARRLRGDIDKIIMTAIRPEPSRRYASAMALADDIGRNLDGLPIHARGDSPAYLFWMFAMRHRRMVAAACLTLVAALGILLALWSEERRSAEEERRTVAEERHRANARIVELEQEARKTRREIEGGLDQSVGWIRLTLARHPEIRALLESRVEDERAGFDILVERVRSDPQFKMVADDVANLVEPELKLASVLEESRDPEAMQAAQRLLNELEERLAKVPEGVLDARRTARYAAKVIEARGDLLIAQGAEAEIVRAEFEKALDIRKRLLAIEPLDSLDVDSLDVDSLDVDSLDVDFLDRYWYGKTLARACERAYKRDDHETSARLAEELIRVRSDVLARGRSEGKEAALVQRFERDLAEAFALSYRADMRASRFDAAEAALAPRLEILRARLARLPDQVHEVQYDLALALDDLCTLALVRSQFDQAARAADEAANSARDAALRLVNSASGLPLMLNIVERRAHLLLGVEVPGASEFDSEDEADVLRNFLQQLSDSTKGNPNSLVDSHAQVVPRIERLRLLEAEFRARAGDEAPARLLLAERWGITPRAGATEPWVVGILRARASIARIGEARARSGDAPRLRDARSDFESSFDFLAAALETAKASQDRLIQRACAISVRSITVGRDGSMDRGDAANRSVRPAESITALLAAGGGASPEDASIRERIEHELRKLELSLGELEQYAGLRLTNEGASRTAGAQESRDGGGGS